MKMQLAMVMVIGAVLFCGCRMSETRIGTADTRIEMDGVLAGLGDLAPAERAALIDGIAKGTASPLVEVKPRAIVRESTVTASTVQTKEVPIDLANGASVAAGTGVSQDGTQSSAEKTAAEKDKTEQEAAAKKLAEEKEAAAKAKAEQDAGKTADGE